jgi:hypothetical protein
MASSFIVTLLKRMYGCDPLGERNSSSLSFKEIVCACNVADGLQDMQESAETGRSRICKAQWLAETGSNMQVFLKKDEGGQGLRWPGINSGCRRCWINVRMARQPTKARQTDQINEMRLFRSRDSLTS